jgi:hypothetical protein
MVEVVKRASTRAEEGRAAPLTLSISVKVNVHVTCIVSTHVVALVRVF